MSSRYIVFSALAVVAMLVSLQVPAFAQAADAGGTFLSTFQDVITGSIGTFLGLGITLVGLWTWIIKQETGAGIVMIVGGVLITLAPSLFNGMQEMVGGVMQSISGSNSVNY